MSTTLLQLSDLCVSYGPVEAVHHIDLEVHEGEIVTVIGPNGAGKTTLLSAAMGLLPARGTLRWMGQALPRITVEAMVARGVGLVPEKRELFGEMSVEDNLLLGGFSAWRERWAPNRLRRRPPGGDAGSAWGGPAPAGGKRDLRTRMDEVFGIFPRLKERRAQLAATLSGGERQMLAIGRALMAGPKLLMLDEPSLGLAPLIVREVLQVVAGLRERGVAVLLVEQNARAALQIADRGYVLEMGSVALSGPADELARDPRIVHTYLGLGGDAVQAAA